MSEGELSQPAVLTVEARAHGWRVDHYLARVFSNYSRAMFQRAIEQQAVLVNGLPVKMSRRLRVNDVVSVRLPELPDQSLPPEDIPLTIVYEDESLVVINKPAGLIVHPGKGNYGGTLAGALQFHFDKLSDMAGKLRPGIVHRLDRNTSGILLVAKDNQVHHRLSGQFERREVKKEYRAITWGVIERDSDYIETCMRVHPKQREKMMVCELGGGAREAATFYEVLERFPSFTYVRLRPRTGRTHQLRVHMKHLGHPIVADRLYGGRDSLEASFFEPQSKRVPGLKPVPLVAEDVQDSQGVDDAGDVDEARLLDEEADAVVPASPHPGALISRQALHAFRLEFVHPVSGKVMAFEAPPPADFQNTLDALRTSRRAGIL